MAPIPKSEFPTEEKVLEEFRPLLEESSPGSWDSLLFRLTADRAREGQVAYQIPSTVSAEDYAAGQRTGLATMGRRYRQTVEAIRAAKDVPTWVGTPKDERFHPIEALRGMCAVARDIDRADAHAAAARAWRGVTDQIDSLKVEFDSTPVTPYLQKAEAELRWRLAAQAAGVAGGDRGLIRRLKERIEDLGGPSA